MGQINEQKIALKPASVGRFGDFAKKPISTISTISTVKRLTAVLATARRRAAIAEGALLSSENKSRLPTEFSFSVAERKNLKSSFSAAMNRKSCSRQKLTVADHKDLPSDAKPTKLRPNSNQIQKKRKIQAIENRI